MKDEKPSYEMLEARLARAEEMIAALRNGQVDVILGEESVYMVRLKEAEDAAERNRALFQNAFENAAVGIAHISLDGHFVRVNRKLCDILGYDKEELQTMTSQGITHPEDLEKDPALMKLLLRGEIDHFTLEKRYIRKDGGIIWVRLTASLQRPDLGIAVVEDITWRKQAEEDLAARLQAAKHLQRISTQLIQTGDVLALYEQILDTTVEIMEADFASIQMLWPGSDGELRLLGYRGFSDQAAKFWEWVSLDSESSCGEALRKGQRVVVSDVLQCEFMTETLDREMYLQNGIRAVQSTPLLSRSGKLLGMISTHWREPHEPPERELRSLDVLARQAADLIERSQAEEELKKAREQLEVRVQERTAELEAESERRRHLAKRLVDVLEEDRRNLSMMLHDDIGQIIAGSKMQIENLKNDLAGIDPEVPSKMDPILESLQGIISSLRSRSRELRPNSLDNLGLAAALRSIGSGDSKCRIRYHIPEEPEGGHPDLKLANFRIAQEAVINALKHADCSEIYLSLVRREDILTLMVEDNGRGFSWEELVTRETGQGPMGMLIMRERAVNAGGEFRVESAPGKGTTVIAEFRQETDPETSESRR